ncbi:MAG: Fe-S protein assembly co-chaperone HscB [Planctomycetota bacterium]
MPDPFELLGVEPRFDLDPKALERRHLQLARELHPDHQDSPEASARVLQQSADANDAYRLLKNPWKRARALIERLDASAIERNQKPEPAFLMEVMEIRERIEDLAQSDEASARSELEERIDGYLRLLGEALAIPPASTDLSSSAIDQAARLLHDAGYFRQALARLDGDLD